MAFMKYAKIYGALVVLAFTLMACAKRDSEFAARRNAAGAAYVNGDQAAAAEANAAANGYKTDILEIATPVYKSGIYEVTSTVRVNDVNYRIVTTHSQPGIISETRADFAGANYAVSGVCGDDQCTFYFLVINITRNGQPILQTAMKKNFYYSGTSSSYDLALSKGPNEFLSTQDIVNTLSQSVVESN